MNVHERHIWQTRSRHSTSDGLVAYQQCACGQWRVTLAEGEYAVHAPDGDQAA